MNITETDLNGTIKQVTELTSKLEIKISTDYRGQIVATAKVQVKPYCTSTEDVKWIYSGNLNCNGGGFDTPELPFQCTEGGKKVWEAFSEQVKKELVEFIKITDMDTEIKEPLVEVEYGYNQRGFFYEMTMFLPKKGDYVESKYHGPKSVFGEDVRDFWGELYYKGRGKTLERSEGFTKLEDARSAARSIIQEAFGRLQDHIDCHKSVPEEKEVYHFLEK